MQGFICASGNHPHVNYFLNLSGKLESRNTLKEVSIKYGFHGKQGEGPSLGSLLPLQIIEGNSRHEKGVGSCLACFVCLL